MKNESSVFNSDTDEESDEESESSAWQIAEQLAFFITEARSGKDERQNVERTFSQLLYACKSGEYDVSDLEAEVDRLSGIESYQTLYESLKKQIAK